MIALNAAGSIFSIIIMISIGYILTCFKWLNDDISRVFSKLVCNVALPCLMISNIMGNFTKDKLEHIGKGLVIPVLSMAIGYVLAIAVSKIIKVKKGRIGTFRSMFFVSNSIFVGLPINMALFGTKSVPYVLLYYISNTVFFWTIGAYGITKDGINSDSSASIFSKNTLKRILSPPLLGFVLAIIFLFCEIKLPSFVMDTCKYLGEMTTPLSMLFIGITLYYVDLKKIKISLDIVAVLIGRFVVSPVLILILGSFFTVPNLMKQVFVIQAAMPVMTNTSIVAREYGADCEYAAVVTSITTILSMVVIPVYMVLIS
ncbi:MAG: AEC family transporter [Clostridium sp.]|jgi:predicted permease|uniref:AEC family transporter n=1 Tax=Clostridium sp. TaxID=1506 RepID=UPI0025C0A8F2|nr:AEC family transporter [Clostridium sp.]MCH3963779.1 AEC family transporter [Clostridium sp.]MCI1714920.1 AEC family transporter [Clostridium sp.]MCI1798891.1 AEC family transporter [Clostridium sp.]MCI1813103.1 AEC family transporter [Clostridium sp.]MCI1869993.1 AEC family transporter [Clostridium sp.]